MGTFRLALKARIPLAGNPTSYGRTYGLSTTKQGKHLRRRRRPLLSPCRHPQYERESTLSRVS
jgi:hypothetical protein